MRWIEAKRLATAAPENKMEPVQVEEPIPPHIVVWEGGISPEAYLSRWPEGPRADLARQVIGEPDDLA